MTTNIFSDEYLQAKREMERMGTDTFLRTYPPRSTRKEAVVYKAATEMKDRQIKDLKSKMNQLHDKIDALVDEIFTLKNKTT